MWSRTEYENAAKKIGETFVKSGGEQNINDLSTTVAKEAQLNPDGIRTLVRLANVSAFEALFSKAAADSAEDRMIEFDVGDPEAVINKLHGIAKEAHALKKVDNYNKSMDWYGDIPTEHSPLEKTASAVPGVEISPAIEGPASSKEEVWALFKRAEDKMREDSLQAEMRWFTSLEKAADVLRAQDSRVEARTNFEKEAVSLLGEKVCPELLRIQSITSPKGAQLKLFGGEKLAQIAKDHIANPTSEQKLVLDMVKEAHESRVEYSRCRAGLAWIQKNLPKIK